MDLSTLPAVSAADLAQPVNADFYVRHGATPEQAAALASEHNAAAGRSGFNAMAESRESFRNQPPPPPTPAAPPPTTNAQLADAAVQYQNTQLAGALDATFAPPANAFDYRAPPPLDGATDAQYAADGALKTVLHTESTPAYIGNAIMSDLAANRMVEHTLQPAERTLVLGHLSRMLDQARAAPALKAYVQDATPEGLLSSLSRETVISLIPWVQYRAGKR
jgi:hypothetical protein